MSYPVKQFRAHRSRSLQKFTVFATLLQPKGVRICAKNTSFTAPGYTSIMGRQRCLRTGLSFKHNKKFFRNITTKW